MENYPNLRAAVLSMRDEHGRKMFKEGDISNAMKNLLGASVTPSELRIAEGVLLAWSNYGRLAQ